LSYRVYFHLLFCFLPAGRVSQDTRIIPSPFEERQRQEVQVNLIWASCLFIQASQRD